MIAATRSDLSAFLDDAQALLDAPAGRRRSALAHAEHTLTSGYAHALGLEAERVRLERDLLSAAEAGESGEVVAVTRRMAAIDTKLAHLRGLLSTLRAHVYDPRAAG